ncbi:30S ribosomal protein S13 [Candidatus Aciduliprofundum boonei]|uniref:Small ribosomal subunit protein uS13 n=1 Tax=Aciduliprofundum boonei (strain DSM 19572 / T469) TaxID=439481 RepID=D3TAS4_ACIB4|nr:30S ribosomal protein S13 [Candidatus Aciduliprofundum boonei]ADD09203.1 ribosomal protein S13P [Aciduliprofundum boonei T469]HII55833.1 30S ribosomal protein S13 [Candidatus Aciduliprofundum boonei]
MAEFKYIVRIADTDLDGNRPVIYAIQGIKGIGYRVAEGIVKDLNMDPKKKIGELSDEQIEEIRVLIEEKIEEMLPSWMMNHRKDYFTGEDRHILSTELDLQKQDDINRLKRIKCYRGVRHEKGLRVRGQRTRSNGRSGLTVGVSRKKR